MTADEVLLLLPTPQRDSAKERMRLAVATGGWTKDGFYFASDDDPPNPADLMGFDPNGCREFVPDAGEW
jgi:hypothetical protein